MSGNFSKQNSRLLFEKCKNNETDKAIEMINDMDNLRININERFEGGCTSFFISCYLGNIKLVQALAEIGKADITIESDNIRPFTVACVRGRIPIVDYLLSNYSDRIDADSMITGCVGATQYGFPQIVRRILGRGLDVNLAVDDQGATLLYVATENDHEEVISLLLSLGADPNRSRCGYYPIHLACQSGNLKTIESLLKYGSADPNVQTPDGATGLLIAAQNGFIKVVDLLYKYRADPNIQMKTDGSFPLYVAAVRHHLNTVDAILDNSKVNVNLSMHDGTTVLHVLAQFDYTEPMEKIFKNFKSSVIIDKKNQRGVTPLLLGARHGQHKACQILIDNGANINITVDGESPLSVATRYGRTETINCIRDALNKQLNNKQSSNK